MLLQKNKKSFLSLMAGVVCLGLAACVTTPMPINNPAPDYSTTQPTRLDIAEVLVINDASTTTATEQLMQYGESPEAALRNWANSRVQAAGSQGAFSVIIKDANFAITKLPVTPGIKGWMERQQAERWDAYLNVMISVEGSASQLPPAEITINLRTSQTLGEEATDSEKRQTYASIMNKLMTLFNAEAKRQMDAYFRAYYM